MADLPWDEVPPSDCYMKRQGGSCGREHLWATLLETEYRCAGTREKGESPGHPSVAEHIHTFPVDATLTPDEAWHELCLMGVRATNTGSETWANIRCDGDECDGIAEAGQP